MDVRVKLLNKYLLLRYWMEKVFYILVTYILRRKLRVEPFGANVYLMVYSQQDIRGFQIQKDLMSNLPVCIADSHDCVLIIKSKAP